jgi:3'5'-cyclic nucleotide phosphodiesterase
MIQVSETTAKYLREAGKQHWLSPRLDPINAKGKGLLRTFWVNPHAIKHQQIPSDIKSVESSPATAVTEASSSFGSVQSSTTSPPVNASTVRKDVRVEWINEILLERIKAVVAVRKTPYKSKQSTTNSSKMVYFPETGRNPMDEITESIALPQLDELATSRTNDVVIDYKVIKELRLLSATIAALYADNPFHNFDHACHVTQSINKLLSRIVTPTYDVVESTLDMNNVASHMYHYTHGINSDPITLLALVISGLIHDTDHRGKTYTLINQSLFFFKYNVSHHCCLPFYC